MVILPVTNGETPLMVMRAMFESPPAAGRNQRRLVKFLERNFHLTFGQGSPGRRGKV